MKQLNLGNNSNENLAVSTACIVVPTYNEAKNITKLLDRIYYNVTHQKRSSKVEVHVLVVDDNSPDGTANIVKDYAKKNSYVHLLLRNEKEGLGKAYIAGMKHALTLSSDVIFEMDADLSHDPDDIFRMIEALEEGYDMIIGSRYIKGGRVPKNWGLHRHIISACATTITRIGLGFGGIRDCSGGYRAIRSSILRKIDFNDLHVKGYAFQAVLLEAVLYHGGKVKEIPIFFHDRLRGESKMGLSDMMEGWVIIYRIRVKRFLGKKKKNTEHIEPLTDYNGGVMDSSLIPVRSSASS